MGAAHPIRGLRRDGKGERVNLYHVQCEGEDSWVEAKDFGSAVGIWRASAIAEFGDDYLDAQPDSVARVHDGPVLRKPAEVSP